MVFSSTLFLFVFLPITLLVYSVIAKQFKNYWLLFVSVVFFAWSQPKYLWIILLSIGVNYCGAILLSKFQRFKKLFLFLTVAANLGLLFYFKYFDFTIFTINRLFQSSFELKNIVLPVGISFFTFQGMSYTIDTYRGWVPAQKNIFKLALYITLFPQLIAGPIVRYKDVESEIECRSITLDDFAAGIQRFIIGLGKKAIIANSMASMVDSVWNYGIGNTTWSIAWVASIAYTLQIFFDFSGYSDMAIGLGRMFGFHFLENFDQPYISTSITEFWRRWHISLSSWFRDYVYIPLGGNRKHVYMNLAIVFLLTGIWHGASWHFIVWGIWNGFFILLERAFKSFSPSLYGKSAVKRPLWKWMIAKFYTLMVVNLGWILFRAPGLSQAVLFVQVMLGMVRTETPGFALFWYLDRWTFAIMIIGIILSTSIPSKIIDRLREHIGFKPFLVGKYIGLLLIFCLSVMSVVSGTYNPFIYFQF